MSFPSLYLCLSARQGKSWWDFRHKVNPVMMMPKTTKLYVPQIDTISADFVDHVERLLDSDRMVPAEFFNELNKWSLESIAYIMLDLRLNLFDEGRADPKSQRIMECVKLFFDYTFQLDMLPSIWKFYKTPMFKKHMANTDEMIGWVFLSVVYNLVDI